MRTRSSPLISAASRVENSCSELNSRVLPYAGTSIIEHKLHDTGPEEHLLRCCMGHDENSDNRVHALLSLHLGRLFPDRALGFSRCIPLDSKLVSSVSCPLTYLPLKHP